MITIDILTKKGTLVKLDPTEAEEVYQALEVLFNKTPGIYTARPYHVICRQCCPTKYIGGAGSSFPNGYAS